MVGTYGVGRNPAGIAFDGTNIWVTNHFDFSITLLRASDGKKLALIPAGAGNTGMVFDGRSMWVANSADGTVMKLKPKDGSILGTFPVGPCRRI